MIFSTRRIPIRSLKDRLPSSSSTNVIYQFHCTSGCKYIGKTTRCLNERVMEHLPKWLNNILKVPPRSTAIPPSRITRLLQVCPRDIIIAKDGFTIRYFCVNGSIKILGILESLIIMREKPDLCAQKDFLTTLFLPW